MEIIVSGRHYQITPEFKSFSEDLIRANFCDIPLKIETVRLVLVMESKERFKAEIIIGVKGNDIEASSEAVEMGKAIAEAIEKAAKQARKRVEKFNDDKKQRTAVKQAESVKAAEAELAE